MPDKEEYFMKKRLCDLANQSYQKNRLFCSDFLNLNEQNIFYQCQTEFPPVNPILTGGSLYAERKIAVFSDRQIDMEKLPICLLKITPLQKKFADSLGHRDFLGAILNLGLERSKIGDIFVQDGAYVFCKQEVCNFIKDNLLRVKHTSIQVEEASLQEEQIIPRWNELKGSIASFRIDCMIAFAFKLSRQEATRYITQQQVFINGKLVHSNAENVKEDQIISVRGLGRFLVGDEIAQTKKGRKMIRVKIYT